MQLEQLMQTARGMIVDPLGNPGATAIALIVFVAIVLVVVLVLVAWAFPGRHDDES